MKPDWTDEAARLMPSALRHHLIATGWRDVTRNEALNAGSPRCLSSRARQPGNRFLMVGTAQGSCLPFRTVSFDHRVFEPLREVARVLRESSSSPGTVVEGYVASFDREAKDPTRPGEVVPIATIEDRPGTPKVHMELSPDAYAQAILAHQAARRVRVTGTLTREGRRYVLRDPGGFGIVPGVED